MLSLEYIAGLFDGEGHVSITATKRRSGTDPKLTVRLTNTFLPIIREIQHMYGGHIYKARKVKEHYLQVYVLSLTVEESKKFLSDILPFLHIKRDQATYALKFSSTVYRRGKGRVTDEERLIRKECMQSIYADKRKQF